LRLARSAETNEFKEYAAATPGLEVSVFAEESLMQYSAASRPAEWQGWTHVWEQGFASAALAAYLGGDSPAVRSERANWTGAGVSVEAQRVFTYPIRLARSKRAKPLPDNVGQRALPGI
jgi:hypothetical protein